MSSYIRFDRNGKTSQHKLIPAGLRLVYDRELGKYKYESRVRSGKTAKDRRNGCQERSFQRKRARDEWRNETRERVYSDPQAVPAFPS